MTYPYGTQGRTDPGTRRTRSFDRNLTPYWSTSLWNTCPLMEDESAIDILATMNEQWTGFNTVATTGDYTLTTVTSGTAVISTSEPGVLQMDCGAATAGQGVNLQRQKSNIIPALTRDIWAEFRVKLVTSVNSQFFVGLAAVNTTVIASNALATANCIGFSSVTTNGVILATSIKASAAATQSCTTMVAGTYQNLGFYYNSTADTVQFYVNGVPNGSVIATANIPKVALSPTFVNQGSGSGQPVMYANAYRVMQRRT